jgi:uncharacterized protein involved in exopolysaccharide biosynthesis
MLTKPAYNATAVIDIERQHAAPVSFARDAYGGGEPEFLPSQTQLMQSREIGERVVRRLNLLANPDFNPKRYQKYRPDAKGKVPVPTPEAIISAALDVQNRIEASIVRGTSLVEITCTAPTARLAANLANAVAEAYIEWNGEARFKEIGSSAQFPDRPDQPGEGRARGEGEGAHGLRPAPGHADFIRQLHGSRRVAAGRVAAGSRDRDDGPDQQGGALPGAARDADGGDRDGIGAAQVMAIRGDLQKLEREYQDKLAIYKPELPAMKSLQKQIENTRESLAGAQKDAAQKAVEIARTEYMTALRREQNLLGIIRSQKNEVYSQGTEALEYKNLRVEIETKRGLLDNLLRQQGETEVVSRLRDDQVASARIVDRAIPPGRPFKPSYQKNLVIFLFLGSVLGIGLAFVMSYLDRSLRAPEQVEQLLNLPALGVIPAVDRVPTPGLRRGLMLGRRGDALKRPTAIEFLPHEEPRSPIAEAYRAFRTALLPVASGRRALRRRDLELSPGGQDGDGREPRGRASASSAVACSSSTPTSTSRVCTRSSRSRIARASCRSWRRTSSPRARS